MAGILKEFVRLAVYDWIRDDAPTSIKMQMDKRLCDKLVERIAKAVQEQHQGS